MNKRIIDQHTITALRQWLTSEGFPQIGVTDRELLFRLRNTFKIDQLTFGTGRQRVSRDS